MAARARNILVGYDGTESGRRALAAAADLTGYASTLSVAPIAPRNDAEASAALLRDAREQLLRHDVPARFVEPAGELVETARMLGIDLLVVGRATDSSPSPARSVGENASCDVLIIAQDTSATWFYRFHISELPDDAGGRDVRTSLNCEWRLMWSGGFLYPGGFQRAGDFEVGTIFDESVLSVRD